MDTGIRDERHDLKKSPINMRREPFDDFYCGELHEQIV